MTHFWKREYFSGVSESEVEDYFLKHYKNLGFEKIERTKIYPHLNTCDVGDYFGYRNGELLIIELEAYSSGIFLHNVDRLRAFNICICYFCFNIDKPKLKELGIEVIELNEYLDPVFHNEKEVEVSEVLKKV